MDIHCANNWLYHEWGPDGKCIRRCGATLYSDQGTQLASTLVDDQSLSEVLSPAHLVDPPDQRGSRHHRHSEADDSSSSDAAGNLADLAAL